VAALPLGQVEDLAVAGDLRRAAGPRFSTRIVGRPRRANTSAAPQLLSRLGDVHQVQLPTDPPAKAIGRSQPAASANIRSAARTQDENFQNPGGQTTV
jgi:hypothetical protein